MIELDFMGSKLRFRDSGPTPRKRVATFETKEPDTVLWIKALNADDVLWDIGANIGIYTIPAATICRVIAFEPLPENSADLAANIAINDSNAVSLSVALSDKDGFDVLVCSTGEPGSAMNTIGSVGYRGLRAAGKFSCGVITARGDTLCRAGLAAPTAIKIDVDGIEHRIVPALVWNRVRTAIIEVDSKRNEHLEMIKIMGRMGFSWSETQALSARRVSGPNDGVGNIVFQRSL